MHLILPQSDLTQLVVKLIGSSMFFNFCPGLNRICDNSAVKVKSLSLYLLHSTENYSHEPYLRQPRLP
jgi:hypothetical protein